MNTRLPDLETLRQRLSEIVPQRYQVGSEPSLSRMPSAGLRFNPDGTVAWDKIWGSFCDLALAGGPPHKGRLLEPGSAAEIAAQPGPYRQVVDELCRGIALVTGLDAEPASPGWVRISCTRRGMAAWLQRAITLENVAVTCNGDSLCLPAGPAYRLDKQIKNVITVIAKTCHYWRDHMPLAQQLAITHLFAAMDAESPLISPGLGHHPELVLSMARAIEQQTGLHASNPPSQYSGWFGIDCATAHQALRIARLMLAANILARREETTLFVPVNPQLDPSGNVVIQTLAHLT